MSTHIYESWEDGNSALAKYEGPTDRYAVVNVDSERHGSNALEGDAGYARIDLPDGDGPDRGETFAISPFIPEAEEQSARVSLIFAEQTPAVGGGYDGYVLVADHSEGRLRLGVREEGSYRWPSAGEVDFDPSGTGGTWTEIHVDFGFSAESDIRIEYRDGDGQRLADVVLEDGTFDGGGWGYALWTTSGNDPSARLDYLRDTTPDSTEPSDDPPQPPKNLRLTARTDSSVTVEWDHSPDYNSGGDN